MRSANIYINGELAGTLSENKKRFIFVYTDEYMNDKTKTSISLTLPKGQKRHHCEHLFPFFYNMLSEGVNKQVQLQKYRIDEEDSFGLLLATTQKDTIGAITIIANENENN